MWPTYGAPIHEISAVLTELAPSVVATIATRAAISSLLVANRKTGAKSAETLSDVSEKSFSR